MNYRHEFHAGNFADVFKHIFLTRSLLYLRRKDTPFRYIDTHAGSGSYDLAAEEAARTVEWRDGIARLAKAEIPEPLRGLIAPYLSLVGECDAEGRPAVYPGSPMIAKALLRQQDRMICCELHPRAYAALKINLGRDRRAKLISINGFTGLNAFVPPKERRGLVLIDPPFEERDELAQMLAAVTAAYRKWPSGMYMLWYPVKDPGATNAFASELVRNGLKRLLRLELQVDELERSHGLVRSGLILINPPFGLSDEAQVLLPWLSRHLAKSTSFDHRVEWLAGE